MEGLDIEPGSIKESLAVNAFRREQEIKYLNTLVVVQSIMHAASTIIASAQNANSPSPDRLTELLEALHTSLIPEYSEARDEKAARVKKILEDAANQKPFQIQAMVYKGKKGPK